jgi:hypothetical protein
VSNGEQGPYVGKVYEFCVPTTEPNVNQLKPIFLSGEQIPAFSGLRGPIALYGDGSGDDGDKFTVQLQRFRDKNIMSHHPMVMVVESEEVKEAEDSLEEAEDSSEEMVAS